MIHKLKLTFFIYFEKVGKNGIFILEHFRYYTIYYQKLNFFNPQWWVLKP